MSITQGSDTLPVSVIEADTPHPLERRCGACGFVGSWHALTSKGAKIQRAYCPAVRRQWRATRYSREHNRTEYRYDGEWTHLPEWVPAFVPHPERAGGRMAERVPSPTFSDQDVRLIRAAVGEFLGFDSEGFTPDDGPGLFEDQPEDSWETPWKFVEITETELGGRVIEVHDREPVGAGFGPGTPHVDQIEAETDAAELVAEAVEEDHPGCDSASCDISTALEAECPWSAAALLVGATETPALDALAQQHPEIGATLALGFNSLPDWAEWLDHHNRYGVECEACSSFMYGSDTWTPETCGNCLAALTPDEPEDYPSPWLARLRIVRDDVRERARFLVYEDGWRFEDIDHDEIAHEAADSCVPPYTSDLAELVADHPSLLTDEPEIGPADENIYPGALRYIVANVYQGLYAEALGMLTEIEGARESVTL